MSKIMSPEMHERMKQWLTDRGIDPEHVSGFTVEGDQKGDRVTVSFSDVVFDEPRGSVAAFMRDE